MCWVVSELRLCLLESSGRGGLVWVRTYPSDRWVELEPRLSVRQLPTDLGTDLPACPQEVWKAWAGFLWIFRVLRPEEGPHVTPTLPVPQPQVVSHGRAHLFSWAWWYIISGRGRHMEASQGYTEKSFL